MEHMNVCHDNNRNFKDIFINFNISNVLISNYMVAFGKKDQIRWGWTGGQAQLKLELGFTSTKIWGIAFIIVNFFQQLHKTELR